MLGPAISSPPHHVGRWAPSEAPPDGGTRVPQIGAETGIMRHDVYTPPQYAPLARRPNAGARLIVIAAVAGILVISVGAVAVGLVLTFERNWPVANVKPAPTAGLVTAFTPLTATTGTVVFTDDFRDPQSGWDAGPGGTDVNYAFANGAYQAVAKGAFFYYDPAPYEEPRQQLSIGSTATLDAHTAVDAGFGVECVRGSGSARLRYIFAAYADSKWEVMRSTGVIIDTNFPTILTQGSRASQSFPGVVPVTLVGVCATLPDGFTRLAFFIGGTKVADMTDAAATTSDGWQADLLAAGSDSGPVTVTVTHFEMRDLSRSGP